MRNYFIFPTPGQTRILALLYIALGLVLCFFGADIVLNTVRIVAALLMAYGLWLLYVYFFKRTSPNARPLVQGIPLVLIGLVIFFSPETLISIFPVVIGMIIIFNSMMQMQKSFMLKDAHDSTWSVSFIVAVMMMIGGLVLILRPIEILAWISRFAGGFLIVEGVYMLIQSFQEQKYLRRRR